METTQTTETITTVAELTRAILAMESAANFRETQAKKLSDRAADLRSKVQAMRETIERIEDAELQAELDTHFTGEDESDCDRVNRDAVVFIRSDRDPCVSHDWEWCGGDEYEYAVAGDAYACDTCSGIGYLPSPEIAKMAR